MKEGCDFAKRDIVSIRDFTREEIDFILKLPNQLNHWWRKVLIYCGEGYGNALFRTEHTHTVKLWNSHVQNGGRCHRIQRTRNFISQKRWELSWYSQNRGKIFWCDRAKASSRRFSKIRCWNMLQVPVIMALQEQKKSHSGLADLYTIFKEKGKSTAWTLPDGRLALWQNRSFLSLCTFLYNAKLNLVSAWSIKDASRSSGQHKDKIEVSEYSNIDDILPEIDVLYVTRIQKKDFRIRRIC